MIHDDTLDRTTDGSGPVRGLPLAALQRLDAGHGFRAPDGTWPYRDRGVRIPTLGELLAAFPDTPVNVEIKQEDPPIEHAVLAVLDRHGARDRTLLAAEQGTIMARIRTAAPAIVTSFSAPEVAEFLMRLRGGAFAGYRAPGIALQVPPAYEGTPIVTEESVAAAHALGLEVHVWTIDEEAEMVALLDLGVDGLMTNFPARAAALFRRRGHR